VFLLIDLPRRFITNGFHEDGLADSFDGWRGLDKGSRFGNMRDSRIGTYGLVADLSLSRKAQPFFRRCRRPDLALVDRSAHSRALDDFAALRMVAICARGRPR